MIDHVSVAVSDLTVSAAAYEHVLGALGLKRLVDRPATAGFGKAYPEFWLNARPGMVPLPPETGIHICLRVADQDAVDAFHAAAIAAGWTDAGAPGPRHAAMTLYYAAFVQDPDGNKLEAATFPRKA
ncbi:MAG: VOC family protein [Acetobacteraceae bacterium]|nr:VOC family protein [Acetobacteraceae bacterium]